MNEEKIEAYCRILKEEKEEIADIRDKEYMQIKSITNGVLVTTCYFGESNYVIDETFYNNMGELIDSISDMFGHNFDKKEDVIE